MNAESVPGKGKRKKREGIPERLRFEVFKRDAFTCVYCGRRPPQVVLHCDHRTPAALEGPTSILNLVTACDACNLGKGAIPLEKQQMLDRHMDDAAKLQEKRRQLEWIEKWYRELAQNDQLMSDTIDQHYKRHVPGWKLNPDHLRKLTRFAKRNSALDCVLDAIQDLVAEYGRTEDGTVVKDAAQVIGGKLEKLASFKLSLRQMPHVNHHVDEARYIFGILRKLSTTYLNAKDVFATLDRALANGATILDLRVLAKRSRSYRDFEDALLPEPPEPAPPPPPPSPRRAEAFLPPWPHHDFGGDASDVLEWLKAVDFKFTSTLQRAGYCDAHMADRCSKAAGPFKETVLQALLSNRDPVEDRQAALERVVEEMNCQPRLDPVYLRLVSRGARGPGGGWVRERFGLASMNYSLASTTYFVRVWCERVEDVISYGAGGPGWIVEQLERLPMPDGGVLADALFGPWADSWRQRYALSLFLEHTVRTTLMATGKTFPPELPGLIAATVDVSSAIDFAVDQAIDKPESDPEAPHIPLSQRDAAGVLFELFVNCGGLTRWPTVELPSQLRRLREACARIDLKVPAAFGGWAPDELAFVEALLRD